MAKTYHDADADLSLIQAKKVAIIGYGSQGHAHALNLKDSGVEVCVGLREGSPSEAKAAAAGLKVLSVAEASKWADVIMNLTPDQTAAKVYHADIAPNLRAGKTLMFAHGFNIRFRTIQPPDRCGRLARRAPSPPATASARSSPKAAAYPLSSPSSRTPAAHALALALSYAKAIGCTRAGVLQTTFTEETETDLFGEQAVLCGGTAALVKAGFETLTEAGYQPELAYFEVLHELKLIVDLMYRGGLEYMRHSISDTAEWGDYIAGPRIVTADVKKAMKGLLNDIQDGTFAKKFIEENETGRHEFARYRKQDANHPLETIGAELRKAMPFLDPVKIENGTVVKA